MDQIKQIVIIKILYIFNLTKASKILVTDIQNIGGNVCSILYNINIFEKYEQYEKKFTCKTVLFFD